MGQYYIAVFRSKNHAMQIHYTLENMGYNLFEIISTPSQLKGGCSYSIKFYKLSDIEYFKMVTSNLDNILYGIYFVNRVGGKTYIEEVIIS